MAGKLSTQIRKLTTKKKRKANDYTSDEMKVLEEAGLGFICTVGGPNRGSPTNFEDIFVFYDECK